MADKNNLQIYAALRNTPSEAQKTIGAGKLKGFTDVNPMFRIQRMTEVFGAQGKGWYFDNVKYWTSEASGEIAAWCSLELKVFIDGEWSKPIHGVGGSKLCGKGVGDGVNDEAFKMAFTDACGIAMKGLGMCGDIYFSKDRTRYNSYVENDESSSVSVKTKSSSEGLGARQDVPTEEEMAIKDFYNCGTIEQLKEVYNGKYGGNAKASTTVKKIVSARLKELSNSGLNKKAN